MDYQHIPLFLGLTILMSACSNELTEEPAPSEGQPVNFKISTVLNRSVTNPDNSTEFIAGDRIGIYGVKGATGSNVALQEFLLVGRGSWRSSHKFSHGL